MERIESVLLKETFRNLKPDLDKLRTAKELKVNDAIGLDEISLDTDNIYVSDDDEDIEEKRYLIKCPVCY